MPATDFPRRSLNMMERRIVLVRPRSPYRSRRTLRAARCAVLGFLAFLGAAALPATADDSSASTPPRRRMTVEDLWAVQRVGAPAPSPDGRWIACTVTSYSMTENKGQGDLWIVDATGKTRPRRVTTNKGPDSSPRWSPDGTRIAYVSKRGDDPAQL